MNDIHRPPLFTLIILMALASVGAVLFTPGIPAIKKYFLISSSAVQWTVTIFILGYAFGQLVYGPFANRFGRKKTLYISIVVAIIGCLISGLSSTFDSYSMLLVGRLIMAIGSGAGLTVSFTMIHDVYSAEESRSIISYTILAFSILPGLATFIGGFVVRYFSWEACFYFLAFYYVGVFVLCIYLPETSKGIDHEALCFRSILNRYGHAVMNAKIWVYTLMWGIGTTIIYIYVATAPIIAIVKMGLTPDVFGTLSLFSASTGLAIGSLVSVPINKRYTHSSVILFGSLIMVISAVALYIFSDWVRLEPISFFSCMFVLYFGMPFVVSNATALAPQGISDKASASSMMSFINMMCAVVGLFLMGFVHANPEHILPEVFLIVVVLQVVLYLISRTQKIKSTIKE